MSSRLRFLLAGPAYRESEVAESGMRLAAQNGIFLKRIHMLGIQQDAPVGIDNEAAEPAANKTCQPQLARRIKKDHQVLTYAIALAAGPKSHPLSDRQALAGSGPANGLLHVECDGDGLNRLTVGRRASADSRDST
jgi:hypothetical protein